MSVMRLSPKAVLFFSAQYPRQVILIFQHLLALFLLRKMYMCLKCDLHFFHEPYHLI